MGLISAVSIQSASLAKLGAMSRRSLNSSEVGGPWPNCEELTSVVDGLFSDAREHVAAALRKTEEWQKQQNLPVEVEISALLTSVFKEVPTSFIVLQESLDLSQHTKILIIVGAIQRLVSSVVDKPSNYTQWHPSIGKPSIRKCSIAGLPSLLVDVRNGSAHGTIHELPSLLSASKEALVWLKANYWEKKLKPLVKLAKVRSELKICLDLHCIVVSQLFDPLILHQFHRHPTTSSPIYQLKKMDKGQQERLKFCFEKLLDLSLSSLQELVFIIVHTETLTSVDLSLHDILLQISGSVERFTDLTSAKDIALRYTIRQLSFHKPELPATLLMTIMKHINSNRFAEFESDTIKSLIRLTAWCTWLLGEEFPHPVEHSDGVLRHLNLPNNDLLQLQMLEIPLAKLVKVELRKQFVDELLQLYDQTLVWGFLFPTLEPHMSLGGNLDDVFSDSQYQTIGLTLRGFQGKGATIDDQCKHPDGVIRSAGKLPYKTFHDAGDMLPRSGKRRRNSVEGLHVAVAQRSASPNTRQPIGAVVSVNVLSTCRDVPHNETAREFGGMVEQLSPQDRELDKELSPDSRRDYMMNRVVQRLELVVLRQYKRIGVPVVP